MPAIDKRHMFHRKGKGGDGATWFLKLAVPAGVRHHFPSKEGQPRDKIVESLRTTDLHEAQRRRDERLVYWPRRFEAARSGAVLDPEQVAEAGRQAYSAARAATAG